MIQVTDLHKNYGSKEAVRGITFQVQAGEVFGFLGPNGAGKSTTIKMLTGQLAPTAGDIRVMGYRLPADRHQLAHQMGVTPENANLYERLSVKENLNLFCQLYNVPTKRGDELLERIGLAASAKTLVRKLSKGMKQRVLLIRALLHSPRLLFLDEPTSGLDPSSAASIHGVLQELNSQGATIFITTHNMEEADQLCHRVAFLNDGLIAELGRPEDLKREYGEERLVVTLLQDGQQVQHSMPLRGMETGHQVGRWLTDGDVIAIHSVESTLADIFIRATGRKLA